MTGMNCWEILNCGRQPGGTTSSDLGICPASTYLDAHGINNGINGGRACWAINGTLCGNKVQNSHAEKLGDCLECIVYNQIRNEEGDNYSSTKDIRRKIYAHNQSIAV